MSDSIDKSDFISFHQQKYPTRVLKKACVTPRFMALKDLKKKDKKEEDKSDFISFHQQKYPTRLVKEACDIPQFMALKDIKKKDQKEEEEKEGERKDDEKVEEKKKDKKTENEKKEEKKKDDKNTEEVVDLLLKNGCNPNLADKDGWTPLHIVCNREDLTEVFFAICDDNKLTMQVDTQDNLGNTPLHLASSFNNKKGVELLLNHSANPNLVNKDGLTPLQIICKREDTYALAYSFFKIIDNNQQTVELDILDNCGNTPTLLALTYGNIKLAKLLLKRGADADLANMEGITPLDLICNNYNKDGLKEITNTRHSLVFKRSLRDRFKSLKIYFC